jgi:membrane protein
VVERLPGGVGLLLELVQFALLVFAVAGLFRYVPNTHVRWRHAFAGALFTGVGFEAAKSGLALYLSTVPGISVIYGAFATLPILLLWVYLSWVVVLLGAVIAAYAPSLQMHIDPADDRPGQPFVLALSVLRELHAARSLAARGLTLEELGARLRTDPLRIEAESETLIALGWVGRLDDDGPQRHVLLCEPALTPAAPLIERLLLAPAPAARAFRQRAGLETLSVAELIGR